MCIQEMPYFRIGTKLRPILMITPCSTSPPNSKVGAPRMDVFRGEMGRAASLLIWRTLDIFEKNVGQGERRSHVLLE